MKRIFLILFAVLLTGGMMLQAEPVSESRAREVAMKVLAAQPATKAAAADVKLIWDGEEAATKAAVNPAFYVFGSDRGGFVIIAGDDNVQPVLAISETSQFKVEGMPENVKWWMERMKAYVRNTAATTEAKEQWAMFAETKSGPVTTDLTQVTGRVERLTPEWDQGNNDVSWFGRNVFNTKCPKVGTEYTLTGCVATALGEILTYQSGQVGVTMPTAGTGNVGGYSVSTGYVAPAEYALGATYDWPNLRTLTNFTAIDAVVDANTTTGNALLANLAQLLADLGAMTQANYSTGGTGASPENIIIGLGAHMGMNKAAYISKPAEYSPRQWIEKLQNEIYKRPIIYAGETSEGAGHAFVFDGYGKYNSQDVFHVNFGWGGSCNGYYYYYDLDAGGGNDYSYNCEAIFDFYPNSSSVYTSIIKMIKDDITNPNDGMKYVDGAPLKSGDPLIIGLFYIKNLGSAEYNRTIRLVAVDKNGTVKQVITEFGFYLPLKPNYYSGLTFPASDNLHIEYDFEFGDKIIVQYKNDDLKWEKVKAAATPDALIDELPLMPAAFIKTENSYSVGDYFQFQLMNNVVKYSASTWTITKEGGSPTVISQAEQEYRFIEAGTYKIEAAVKATATSDVVETITTYVTVN